MLLAENMVTSTINTNVSAQIALAFLRDTQQKAEVSRKRVSTDYSVADAFDNGAIFGIAQTIRAALASSVAANQELANFVGFATIANAGATGVSNTLADVRAVLTHLSGSFLTATNFSQYQNQFNNLIASLGVYINNTTYNGLNLISTGSALQVVQNASGNQLTITGTLFNINSALNGVSVAAPTTYTNAGSILFTTFGSVLGSVATVLNLISDLNTRARLQSSFNLSLEDSLNVGLGALVDADLSKESANIVALGIRERLSTQIVGIANQSTRTLLGLFR
jgi:flagellin